MGKKKEISLLPLINYSNNTRLRSSEMIILCSVERLHDCCICCYFFNLNIKLVEWILHMWIVRKLKNFCLDAWSKRLGDSGLGAVEGNHFPRFLSHHCPSPHILCCSHAELQSSLNSVMFFPTYLPLLILTLCLYWASYVAGSFSMEANHK